MTEREILKKICDAWEAPNGLQVWDATIREARKLLAASDPPPEHPAVEAYRKWADVHNAIDCQMSAAFLAGWKQALEWAGQEAGGLCRSTKWFQDISNATPTYLP